MLPAAPAERARTRLWLKRIDDPTHPACGVLTHATAFRSSFLAKTPAEQGTHLAKIPDPARRARQRAVYRDGLDAPIVADAVRTHDRMLIDMEAALADAPFLAGAAYSLADAAATPDVNRLQNLGLLTVWAATKPRMLEWYARIQQRPSFKRAITDYVTDADAAHLVSIDRNAPDKIRAMLAA